MSKVPASPGALAAIGAIALAGLGASGCSTRSAARYSSEAVAAMSPAAEVVRPLEAMALGRTYVCVHPGTDYLVGSGDSMLPLYGDNTVVVTRRVATADLRAGMTAVYVGDSGRPVAHVLVRRTLDGWIAQGVGNAACDSVRVTGENLVGIVVRAFEPSASPLLSLLNESFSGASVAWMP